jgi:hypothetical protein
MTISSNFAGAQVLGVDFETHWKKDEYSVSDMGAWAYTHDPRFLCYLAGFADPASGRSLSVPPNEVTADDWAALAQIPMWVSHNAGFDQAIHARQIELGKAPNVWPQRWLCTGALAGYLQAPRNLQGFARGALNVEISKDYRSSASGYLPGSDLFLDGTLREACALDALTCARAWVACEANWPEHERQLWEQTVECGRFGVAIDREFVAGCIDELQKRSTSFAALLPWTKAPYNRTPRSRQGMELCFTAANVPLPKSTEDDSPELNQWLRKYGNTQPAAWIRHLQGFRKTDRKTALFRSMQVRTNPDTGRMDFELIYCGTAATGRWAGGGGLNMQNLNRDEKGGTTTPRRAFIPPPGKLYVIADLAQIEPRVLAWVCGNEALLEMVRRGVNIYEAHARTTMGWTGGKLKKENERLYALAKVRVIQLGYQSAADTFKQACLDYAGLEITDDEAERQVTDYRKANPLVVTLWGRMENAMAACEGGTYRMPLPSGRVIKYFNVERVKGGKFAKLRASTVWGDDPDDWYGGKLTENLVQSIARDVFAAALLRIEAAGYAPVWHVHDEGIWEVAEDQAEAVAKQIEALMSVTPDWIPGLPVGAEVEITKFYKK